MGACATKPGDLKVKGDAPLVVEDAAEKKLAGVDADTAAAADDVSRRRSLSDLLKEDAESEAEAPSAEKKTEAVTAATDEAGATEVEASIAMTEPEGPDHTAEELEPKAVQDPDAHVQVVEEEKRVDPDSVQVAVVADAQSSEESKVVVDDVST